MLTLIIRVLLAVPLVLSLAAGGLYLYSPPKSLDVLNDFFPGDRDVARMAGNIAFRTGTDLGLDIWGPKGSMNHRRPVIMFFYGGAWVKGERGEYGFVAKAYAAKGFVVVIPDYRKVPSVHFPVYIEDGAAAVRWVHDNIARYGGDPDRVVLAGHSAGAYIAMMLSLDRHYLTEAGVDPKTVRAVVGLAGPYDFYPFDAQRAIDAMGNAPNPLSTQPFSFARSDAPPLLLVTGGKDTDVRPQNAISLAARERGLGNKTTVLLNYPGANHNDIVMALSKPFRNRLTLLGDSIGFIDRALALKRNFAARSLP